ncbi:MAG: RNA methyltransferase [bacterium]
MLSSKTIKEVNKLQQKKYRCLYKQFVVEGIKGVLEAVKRSPQSVCYLIIYKKIKNDPVIKEIMEHARESSINVQYCAEKDINKIKNESTFSGIMAVIKQSNYSIKDLLKASNIILCLDSLKDPGNLGVIVRTMNWFGLKSLVLSKNCVDLYNPKTVRSTMGSIFSVKVLENVNLPEILKQFKEKNGYKLCGLCLNGLNFSYLNKQEKQVLIFGSESHGFSKEVEKMLDYRYTIKGRGGAESLNVGISAAITMSRIN